MRRNKSMKWNNFYRFWTILNCTVGSVWCLALIAILGIYSFGVGLISDFMVLLDTSVIEAAVSLIIKLLINGLIFLILSYAAVSALNKYNRHTGLVRIYLQTFAAAVGHILKIIYLNDFFDVLTRNMQIDLNNVDIGLYAVLVILFIVRILIFLTGTVYFYKRKQGGR